MLKITLAVVPVAVNVYEAVCQLSDKPLLV
jgi:hypothetical protein